MLSTSTTRSALTGGACLVGEWSLSGARQTEQVACSQHSTPESLPLGPLLHCCVPFPLPSTPRRRYEVLSLKVIHRRRSTGFEQSRELPLRVNDLIAGRYQVRVPHEPLEYAV